MKLIMSIFAAAYLSTGCVAGDAVSHYDDPAAVKRDQGPALCRDGTAPPCPVRN